MATVRKNKRWIVDFGTDAMNQSRGFVATKHAIKRYQERIEKCSKRDAIDRLEHAASIARPATSRQIAFCNGQHRLMFAGGGMFIWCEVESLMLVCGRASDANVICTVIRVPSDRELRDLYQKPKAFRGHPDGTRTANKRRERRQKQKAKQFVW